MIDPASLKIPEKGKPAIDLVFAVLLLVATLSTAVADLPFRVGYL